MTTKTHALRLPTQVTEAIVEFSSEFFIDLNTVDDSHENVISIGEGKCGKTIIATRSLLGEVFMVRVICGNGEVLRAVSINTGKIAPNYSIKSGIIKSSKKDIINRLEQSLESLESPNHSDFFEAVSAEAGGSRSLDGEGFKKAYEEADRRYRKALTEFMEKRGALQFAIDHYHNQIKLELAHAIIELDGE